MKKILSVILCAILIASTFCGCTASGKRTLKSIHSNWNGGLDRIVVIYSMTGEEIARYEGFIDIEENESKVLFDLNGKRYIYYNCLVEVIEK
jgi:hypothetical protein